MDTDAPTATLHDTPATALPQGVLRLTDWGLLRASGPDAASFLHGQLTQDVLHLDAGHARLAGYCSAKGRLLASFVIWRHGPEDVMLACSADLLPAVLKRLSMFVLRAKCKLADVSAELPLWGLAGDAAAAPLAGVAGAPWSLAALESGQVIRLPDAVVDGRPQARALLVQPATAAAPAGAALADEAWRWLEVYSGVARISAATVEQFVPQMVNLELVGGVNFQKGCYPGQEVVARSQYRGTLKRRGHILEAGVALQPAQELFHSADPGQPAGMVVLSGQWAGRHAALAELKLAALEHGSLHAGSADGPTVTPVALPYPLPLDAA